MAMPADDKGEKQLESQKKQLETEIASLKKVPRLKG